MKLDVAIAEVRAAETAVAGALDAVGARHEGDHDVFHMTRTLRRLADANLEALAPVAERYGVTGAPDPAPGAPDGAAAPGLELLHDLRRLYLRYAQASIDWVLLGQGAQAAKDAELLDVVSRCHAQTLRGLKWTVTRLKEAAPQALTS